MKLKQRYCLHQFADTYLTASIDKQKTNYVMKMNESSKEAFTLLQNEITEDELVAKLQQIYPDATEDRIRTNVQHLVAQLQEKGLLE